MRKSTHRRSQRAGNGIFGDAAATLANTVNTLFTGQKYPGEHHAISMDPRYKGEIYRYTGPGTRLDLRIGKDKPLNDLDEAAMYHDLTYRDAGNRYRQDRNRKAFVDTIHNADDIFVKRAWNSKDDPKMGKVSAGFIKTKELLEKAHVLPTSVFSGAGNKYDANSDPAFKLRNSLPSPIYKRSSANMSRRRKSRSRSRSRSSSRSSSSRSPSPDLEMDGGAIPIGPIISILSTVGPPIIEWLWNHLKKKGIIPGQTGSGKLHTEDKREMLIQALEDEE